MYYEDTDAGGVVYYANYLKYMERARTEWLRSLGVEQDVLRRDTGRLLMVHSLSVNYHQPAKFNEALSISVKVTQLGKARVVFFQTVLLAEQVLCSANVTIACVNELTGKAAAFPQSLAQVLIGVLE